MQREVDDFCTCQQLPPAAMPPKAEFVRAGRYDISHAIERWGGLYQLADLLGYQVGTCARLMAQSSAVAGQATLAGQATVTRKAGVICSLIDP